MIPIVLGALLLFVVVGVVLPEHVEWYSWFIPVPVGILAIWAWRNYLRYRRR